MEKAFQIRLLSAREYFNQVETVSANLDRLINQFEEVNEYCSSVTVEVQVEHFFDRANHLIEDLFVSSQIFCKSARGQLLPLMKDHYKIITHFEDALAKWRMVLKIQCMAETLYASGHLSRVPFFSLFSRFIQDEMPDMSVQPELLRDLDKTICRAASLYGEIGSCSKSKTDDDIESLFRCGVTEKKSLLLESLRHLPSDKIYGIVSSKLGNLSVSDGILSRYLKNKEDVTGFVRELIDENHDMADLELIFLYEAYCEILGEYSEAPSVPKTQPRRAVGPATKKIVALVSNQYNAMAVIEKLHELLDGVSDSFVIHRYLGALVQEKILLKMIPYEVLVAELDLPGYTLEIHKKWRRTLAKCCDHELSLLIESLRTITE